MGAQMATVGALTSSRGGVTVHAEIPTAATRARAVAREDELLTMLFANLTADAIFLLIQ